MKYLWTGVFFLWAWAAYSPERRASIFSDENSVKVILCIALMIIADTTAKVYRLQERVKSLDGKST